MPSWAGVGLVGGVYITSDEGAKLGWSGTCGWCLYYKLTRVPSWAGVGLVGGVYITSDEGAKLGWSGTCRWCLYYK